MAEHVPNLWRAALEDMEFRVKEVNVMNGWFEANRTFGDEVALLHSEVSEMLEAFRSWGFEDATSKIVDLPVSPIPKPEGVGSEAADVLIRLLDMCTRHDINLAQEVFRKLAYNETRGYRHGNKAL